MEKLSDKNPCNTCAVDRQVLNPHTWEFACDICSKPDRWRNECVEKLRQYEDLRERCIKETNFGLEMLIDKWCEFFEDIEELAEYQKLKEQGRLLELPCNLGDTTFWISDEDECGNKVLTARESNPIVGISLQMDGIYILTDGDDEYQKVGTRWAFLTKEEAEKALGNMEEAGIENDKSKNC